MLPQVFGERFYTGNTLIYIYGNDRIRYKVEIKKTNGGGWMFYDDEWVAFVKSNVPDTATTIHFIRQAVDDYHVTIYKNDGSECFGYDRRAVGPRLIRCLIKYIPGMQILPGDFLQDVWNNVFSIYCDHLRVDVDHERVQLDPNSRRRDNGLFGPGWDELVDAIGLQEGQRIVFTNLRKNRLSMVVIGDDGLGLTREVIYPTLLKMFQQRKIQHRDLKDKRLKQFCNWPFHVDHANEENVFYASLCAIVTDAFRLTIPADFCKPARVLHAYKKAYVVNRHVQFPMVVKMVVHNDQPFRTNHINLLGNWRGFGKACGFMEPKMMRVKLDRIIPEYNEGRQVQVLVSHIC